jgi:hypothetical protein
MQGQALAHMLLALSLCLATSMDSLLLVLKLVCKSTSKCVVLTTIVGATESAFDSTALLQLVLALIPE